MKWYDCGKVASKGIDPDKHVVSNGMDSGKLTLLAATNSLSLPTTAATNDNGNNIIRLQGPANLALHEGFDAFIFRIFPKPGSKKPHH